ncbi:MFS transporter [Janthinobacterium fluminis]|uniref:MFS transporter n=1 Tax=Janthinobacterium fluminis TaxID=2987524 RepID=A0ABT5JZG3_9BURK|nr:MFS transporter [Janthinobacterium fluminis]MDC8758120.1 MFS transporter [Janthinobacterium fluminis]
MRRPHPLIFLATGLFGVYCIEFGVVGILPAIIERYRVTAQQAGLLVGMFALVVAALGPFLVLLASRWRRKTVLVASLWLFAAVSALSAYADSFAALMGWRLVAALCHPVYFSLAMVAAAALYPPAQASRAGAHALVGTSMGMVLGIPMTTWVAAQYSYQASFLLCAAANAVAALGVMLWLPSAPAGAALPYGRQLAILRKPALWLNIAAAVMIFAAMFSLYAYAAEYLRRETGMDGRMISAMLVIFGVGGVLGNLLAGSLLAGNAARTVLLHPLALAAAYLLLHYGAGQAGTAAMAAIALFWGAAHTSGLIVTQVWLTSEAREAPEFAVGVYISAINLGVTVGSLAGGWGISRFGMAGTIGSGLLFAALAAALVGARLALYGAPRGRLRAA